MHTQSGDLIRTDLGGLLSPIVMLPYPVGVLTVKVCILDCVSMRTPSSNRLSSSVRCYVEERRLAVTMTCSRLRNRVDE
jgi:ABC-type transport system involved in cytochrome c biogenesis permease component